MDQLTITNKIFFKLRYSWSARRIGSVDSFHEDQGYFLWKAKNKQEMRCATVPGEYLFWRLMLEPVTKVMI